MASNLKHELAGLIYQYLCHEAQYSDLPETARESLTAASECIEQAYKLTTDRNHTSGATTTSSSNNNHNSQHQLQSDSGNSRSADVLPDELLRIFTRHKEFLSQQQDPKIFPTSGSDKHEIKSNLNTPTTSNLNDPQNSNPVININNNANPTNNISQNVTSTTQVTSPASSSSSSQQPQQATTSSSTKHHSQHPISQLPMTTRKKLSHLRAQIKRQASKHHLAPGSHHHNSALGASVHQKNFKQRLIALLKKFRTDGSDFDSEEQYREALERELMKAADERGSTAIEELLVEVEDESGSEQEDWDNISESSTPKPSLRPFFSSTTLDKI